MQDETELNILDTKKKCAAFRSMILQTEYKEVNIIIFIYNISYLQMSHTN